MDVIGGEILSWGEPRDVSSVRKLEQAVKELKTELDRQRLVWIEGIHLPQDIAFDGGDAMSVVR